MLSEPTLSVASGTNILNSVDKTTFCGALACCIEKEPTLTARGILTCLVATPFVPLGPSATNNKAYSLKADDVGGTSVLYPLALVPAAPFAPLPILSADDDPPPRAIINFVCEACESSPVNLTS